MCGTAAAPGKFVETMNSFSDSDSDEAVSVLVENVPGNPGATIQGIIDRCQWFCINRESSDSFRLEATMKNASPITIDETTRGLTVRFSLSCSHGFERRKVGVRIEYLLG